MSSFVTWPVTEGGTEFSDMLLLERENLIWNSWILTQFKPVGCSICGTEDFSLSFSTEERLEICVAHAHRHTDTQTYRHTDRHTDIQTHRHTDTQTYRHTEIQTYRHTDIQTDIQTHRHTDTQTYRHFSALDAYHKKWICFNILTFCWPCISVYLSQYLTNLMHKICFTISLFHASTCFEHMCTSSGGQNCLWWWAHVLETCRGMK